MNCSKWLLWVPGVSLHSGMKHFFCRAFSDVDAPTTNKAGNHLEFRRLQNLEKATKAPALNPKAPKPQPP